MNNAIEPAVSKIEAYIEGFFWMLPNLGLAVLVFILFFSLASFSKWVITNTARRRHRGDLGLLLGSFVRWMIIVFALLVVATIVFPSVKPADVLAALGFGSVAVGFAFKDILQNWLSGLLILYRQPFRRGDQIRSGEFEGTVENVEARATLIQTYDGQRVVIPNTDIYTRAVTVRTAFPKRRIEYDVGIGYGDDVESARRIILAAVSAVDGVERDPAPEAFAWALDGSSVNIKVYWWSGSQQASVVHSQGLVVSAIQNALSSAGIDLPFPTRVILFHDQTEETDGDRTRQREGWPPGDDPPRARHRSRSVKRGNSHSELAKGGSMPSSEEDNQPSMRRPSLKRGIQRSAMPSGGDKEPERT